MEHMTIGLLRQMTKDLPDDTPVIIKNNLWCHHHLWACEHHSIVGVNIKRHVNKENTVSILANIPIEE